MLNALLTEKHEDERRVLIEWIKNEPVRACKVLVAKEDCIVGEHYHKLKDEYFYLLEGTGRVTLGGNDSDPMTVGDMVYIPSGTKHSFFLSKGSILLGAGTQPYDANDDYK